MTGTNGAFPMKNRVLLTEQAIVLLIENKSILEYITTGDVHDSLAQVGES